MISGLFKYMGGPYSGKYIPLECPKTVVFSVNNFKGYYVKSKATGTAVVWVDKSNA